MMSTTDLIGYGILTLWTGTILVATLVGLFLLKALYNISPLHPLHKYPGPLFWRATRLCASYHHATGDLYKCIARIHEEYGSAIRIAPDELSFSRPEAWPQIYNSRPQLEKAKFHFAPEEKNPKFPKSMITAPDAEHTRLRRLAGPAFLNSGIAEVEPVLQKHADFLCHQLRESSKEGPQNMVEWYLWTLNDVIGQLALDQEFDCLKLRRLHPWPKFLLGVLKQTAAINQILRFGVPTIALAPLITKEMLQEQQSFFKTATGAINQRLEREKDGSAEVSAGGQSYGKGRHPDIVGLMLREMKGSDRLTELEVTSNSILIVGGGAETTSTCLSATMFHLCKTPRVMQKLKDEIRATFSSSEEITLKATASLPYLVATIDESLRIFPVASYITPRMTPKGGHIIDGDVVPANTHVSMGQWYMGRSSTLFDDPMDFRPERWINSEVQSVSGRRIDDILKPFSLGPRNCIGKLLAVAEARLVTAKLLWHFDIELDGDHDTWVDDARFYILWQLQPLNVRLKSVR